VRCYKRCFIAGKIASWINADAAPEYRGEGAGAAVAEFFGDQCNRHVVGQLGGATSIGTVYQDCTFLPLIGLLTEFLPAIEKPWSNSGQKEAHTRWA
jgi:hypothetical protein